MPKASRDACLRGKELEDMASSQLKLGTGGSMEISGNWVQPDQNARVKTCTGTQLMNRIREKGGTEGKIKEP